MTFASDLSSKTSAEGDPVEFLLDSDLTAGQTVVVPKGAHATATVSHAHSAGMMGKGGELSIQLQYLAAAGNHVTLRGTKGREGDSKVGATVALTVLFGPIGLVKHGKEVQIPAGTPLVAYVEQDTCFLPLRRNKGSHDERLSRRGSSFPAQLQHYLRTAAFVLSPFRPLVC